MDAKGLPTDNLYKFLALSGLVAVAFGFWLTYGLTDDLRKEVQQTQIAVGSTQRLMKQSRDSLAYYKEKSAQLMRDAERDPKLRTEQRQILPTCRHTAECALLVG